MSQPMAGKPRWLKVPAPVSAEFRQVRALLRGHRLHTVCESATCPNIGECWRDKTATFMILGDLCTRRCAFCDVPTGKPGPVDREEPQRLGQAVADLKLKYVVITSVDRDDLDDGGASQFAACIEAIRALDPAIAIEVLTPDFRGKEGALALVLEASPDVFNHNVETVPRLYSEVRPVSSYAHSLAVLRQAGQRRPRLTTKSGIMVGLGERDDEVRAVLEDLRAAGVRLLTVGQYLRPSLQHHPVVEYRPPEWFEALAETARSLGFLGVASHPLARSSHHAERLLAQAREARTG